MVQNDNFFGSNTESGSFFVKKKNTFLGLFSYRFFFKLGQLSGSLLASILKHFRSVFLNFEFQSFVLPFSIDLGVHFSLKSQYFVKDIFQKSGNERYRKKHLSWTLLGEHFRLKIDEKSISERHKKLNVFLVRFLIDFGPVLEAKMRPKMKEKRRCHFRAFS